MIKEPVHAHSVVHMGDSIAELKDPVVVSHNDHGAVGLDGGLAEQLHHREPGLMVESRGWFVANQELGVMGQGTSDRDPLHLPARELRGEALHLLTHANGGENLAGAAHCRNLAPAGDDQGNRGILGRCQSRQKVVLLEHETDVPGPEPGLHPIAHLGDVAAENGNLAFIGVEDAGDH